MRLEGGRYHQTVAWPHIAGLAIVVAATVTLGYLIGSIGDTTRLLKVFAGLTILGLAIASLRRPGLALGAVLVAACFQQTMTLLGVPTGSSELSLMLFAPAFVATWRRATVPKAVIFSASLILLGAVIAALFAPDPSIAVWGAARWALVLNGVVAGICYLRVAGQRGLQSLGIMLSALGGIVAVLGWLQMHGHPTFVGPPYISDRPDSSFGYYTNYATFVAIATVVSLGMLIHCWQRRRWPLTLLLLCSLAASIVGVATSLSRGAIVVAVGGTLAFLAIRARRPSRLLATAVTAGVVSYVAYSLTPPALIQQIRERFETSQGGDVYRFQLQAAGRELLAAHPAGIGFGNFRGFVASGAVRAEQAQAHAHNLYIQSGLDNGWLGMVGFVALCAIAVLRGALAGWRSDGTALQGVFAAALAGFCAQALYDYFFFETGSLIVFAALLVGSLATYRPNGRQSPLAKGRATQYPPNKTRRPT